MRAVLGLGVAPIRDLAEAAERLVGVDVGSAPLPEGVSGICATDPQRATSILLVNSTDVAERQRFTLAHELGHLLFGDKTHVDQADGLRTPQEILCDEFARHLLIPQDGVRAWLGSLPASRTRVDERTMALPARHFGASPEATRIQLDRMNLLPQPLKNCGLASGRRWAYRYGWGPEFDIEQDAFRQPRVPRRMLERATEAYRQGKLGIAALAKEPDPVAVRLVSVVDAVCCVYFCAAGKSTLLISILSELGDADPHSGGG